MGNENGFGVPSELFGYLFLEFVFIFKVNYN